MDFPSRFLPLLAGILFVGTATRVAAVAPSIDPISTTTAVLEDAAKSINYADLVTASGAEDPDSSPLVFRYKSTLLGTLTKDDLPVAVNDTLAAGETWVWTPPDDVNGTVSAFSIVAFAGGQESTVSLVSVPVTAVNDVPSFTKGANVTVNEDSGNFGQNNWATAISTGPVNESSQTPTFVFTANNRPDLFSSGPAVNANGRLTFTPAANKSGTATISLKVNDGGGTTNGGVEESAAQTFTITVTAVNDEPAFTKGSNVTVNEDSGAFSQSSWATAISAGAADESAQTLTFEITSNSNAGLFATAPAIASNGTLAFTPAANENGSATIGVRLNDDGGTANGGDNQSPIQTFTITVTAVPDPPVLAGALKGTLAAPLSDEPVGDTGIAVPADIFGSLTITDPDQGRPGNDAQTITVTVSNDSATYGSFSLPGSSVTNGASDKIYTLTASTPAAAQTALRAARFTPLANAMPVGIYDFGIKVEVKDATTPTPLQATPIIGDIHVESVNNEPEVTASLVPNSISDSTEATPFRLAVSDPDPGDSYSVTITETSATPRGTLVIPNNPILGTDVGVAAGIQLVRYQPFQQSADVTATFQIAVTDVHPTGGGGTPVNANVSLGITFVNNAPEFSGITTELIRTTNDPAAPAVYPFSTITITDGDPGQSLTVSLSLDDPFKGGFSGDFNLLQQITGTAAEVTAKLRQVIFLPASNRPSETVTITISVTDGTSTRTNSLTQVEVTAVNGAPLVTWDVSNENPAGIFPTSATPALIDPSPAAEPFEKVTISDEGEIVVTVAIDTPAKGSLSNLGGFVETPADSRIYQFTGGSTAAETAIQGLTFVPNPAYLFPPNQPGRTDFTIKATDSLLNVTTRVLPIILQSDSRNFMVTSLLDDVLVPGTLRHAISIAASNDVITFALPSYPAVIRLSTAKGPLVINKHLTFRGPGADKLTISGDSNANGDTDPGDTQLFRILAGVKMRGLRLTRGFAEAGGAISVGRSQPGISAGSLSLEDCIISNCLASQWGGAIDIVEGSLEVDRCVFENNQLNASSGLGGGAVSLFTNASCSFRNSTFSGNIQAASTGYGGGAIYVENDTPNRFFQSTVTHCTFAGNIDASNNGSSLHCNVANTRVLLSNSLFGDFSARNLQVSGSGEILSNGGNLSNDYTSTALLQSGDPTAPRFLNRVTDQVNVDPKLAPITTVEGQTRGHRLLPDSPAVGKALAGVAVVDQRGVIRDGSADVGAIDAHALGKLLIHEIYASQSSGDSHFIEFFNPRDQVAVDLSGYEIWIDGLKRHVFTGSQVVNPGFGIILADTLITPASASTPVVLPSIAALTANLDLKPRGRIELRAPTPDGAKVVEAVSYNGVFANTLSPANSLDTDLQSLTLAPQFQGAAFVPHGMVQAPPNGGVVLTATGANSSPGADTGGTPFGEDNAYPIAVNDGFEITEDELVQLDVLANDLDADGSDELFLVDLNPATSAVPPASDKASILSPAGASVSINPALAPLRGTLVDFDPRVAFNSLAEGARVTDTFAYSIIDVGGGAVSGYATGGAGVTLVTAPSHRLADGEAVVIRDAGPAGYNGSHIATFVDDNTFSIPVAFTIDPAPLLRGRWQAVEARDPSARSEALVQVSVLGRNDAPSPDEDFVATDEDTILRVFADPDLAGTGMALDTDGLYPQPRAFSAVALLPNDSDPDSNDNPFTRLHVVGVCQASPISGYSGTPGASPVTVTAAAHGLSTGDTILVSGYGGHPTYNGYHEITVTGADTFTLPVGFVDDAAEKGLWTILEDSNRNATVSSHGAAVSLEIRANRNQTNLVYNPRVSDDLNGLAEGESEADTFYYAVADDAGAVTLALVTVTVAGVNDDPVPTHDPDSLAGLDPFLGGGATLPELLGGSEILYLLPGTPASGGVDVAILPPGGSAGDVRVIAGIDRTDEDHTLDLLSAVLLGNDSDVDRSNVLSIEIGAGQESSREGAAITLSPDGQTLTYDPTDADDLQALAFKERVVDTFMVTVFDGFSRVESLVAVLVEGRNDQPDASPVALTTPEKDLLSVGPPGLLLSGLEIDQNVHLPDNRKFLLPVDASPTTVFGSRVNVLLEPREGSIAGFASTPGGTAVTATAHGLETGEEVMLLGSGALTGQYVITRVDDDTFSVPVAFDSAFAALGGGQWKVLASTFQYDPRGSVFSDNPGGPVFTLQGLAAGQTYVDTFTYTLLDGSFLFANDDIFRVEADRSAIELKVLANDVNLEGLATGRRIVSVSTTSAGGTVAIVPGAEPDGEDSILYSPETGFVGDEVFVYTIEDDLGNRDSARVTARVTVDRLNGNLRANADSFTVATGQAPLLEVLANDNIVPATGDPLTLAGIATAPDQGGSAVIEGGAIRFTPDPAAASFPYTETFAYTMSGGGTTTATATVTVLVVDRNDTLNVRADAFSVPASSNQIALNVLENDNILPGTGEALEITAVTAASHGTVTILNDAALSYTPAAGFLGTDSFSYTAVDGFGGTGTALVTVQVGYLTTNTDIFSVAFDDPAETDDDGITSLDVLANDNVLNGGGGQVLLSDVTPPSVALGDISVAPDGLSLRFDPAESATGQQDFTYTIADASGRTATGSVTVVVIAGGIRASSDFFTVQADSADNELEVLPNDLRISDLPGQLSVASIGTGPNAPDQGGTVEISADFKKIIYTAAAGFRGVESFTYTVTDGDTFDTARVSVRSTIGSMVAGDDSFFVFRGSSANRLAVLGNDRIIPDAGQLLFITATGLDEENLTNPAHRGTLTITEEGGALTYTPSPDNTVFPYVETFTYEISSGDTTRAEAILRIEVLDRVGARDLETNNDVFTVRSDSAATLLPVLANDSVLPASAANWVISSVTPATSNVCSPFLNGDFPDPAAFAAVLAAQADPVSQFLWARFSPGSRDLLAAPATPATQLLATLVAEFNDTVGSGSSIHDATRFAGVTLRPQTQGLLEEGVSGEQLIVLNRMLLEDAYPTRIQQASGGGAVQISGNSVLYAPQPGFVGTERFTYRVSDGLGGTGFGEVIVRVGDISVSDDDFTLLAGAGPVDLDVTANDGILRTSFPATANPAQADFTLDASRVVGVDPLDAGSASVVDGIVRFTPDALFTGHAVLTYWVIDDSGCEFPGTARLEIHAPGEDRDTAVASITVTGVNDAPKILNAGETQTLDTQAVQPFANATVVEYDDQRAQLVTIQVSYPIGHGVLGGGFTEVSPGVLEFRGTAAEITAALRALVFTPFIDRITVGTTEDTRFVVSMDDGFTTTPVIVDEAYTVVTPVNDLPVITGTMAGQKVYQRSTLYPFAGVNITDVDDIIIQPQTVTVQVDNAIKGFFSNLGGFVQTPAASGTYVFTGTPAQVSAALRGLVFHPTPDGRVTAALPETVGLSVSIDDGFAAPVVDQVTTVVVLHGEIDRLLPLGAAGQDVSEEAAAFGTSVAVSGNTMVVGSPARELPGSDAGRAYVYERDAGFGAPWGQVATLIGSDTIAGDRFGESVAIDGDFMAIGAPAADITGASNTGAVYIFHRDAGNPNAWNQVLKLTSPTPVNNDAFGTGLAIQGSTLLVGSPNTNRPGSQRAGRVQVFNRGVVGPANWVFFQTLLAGELRSSGLSGDGEFFGFSVALDGETAVIGAHGSNRSANSSQWNYGAAHIFTRAAGTGLWSELKRLDEFEQLEAQSHSGFGYSVDISGDRVAVGIHSVGAPFNAFKPGGARIFERDAGGANNWGEVRRMVGFDGIPSAHFGTSIAIHDELVLIGAPGPSQGSLNSRGSVEVYRRTPGATPTWTAIDRFIPGAPTATDLFGTSVALDGFIGVAGAAGEGVNALGVPNAGGARVYKFHYDLGPRLTVPVPDHLVVLDSPLDFTVDPVTFDDPVSPGQLTVSARLSDGNPLPPAGWLAFDPVTRTFSGTPTAANHGDYDLVLVATNPLGSQVFSNVFQIAVDTSSVIAGLAEAYEAWAATRFSPAELGNPALESTLWGMEANPEGDGRVNLLEMLFGTDPEANEPSPLVFTRISDSQVTLEFPITAEFPLGDIHVEWSTEMNGWSRDGVVLVPAEVTPGNFRMTATITAPTPRQKVFVRVVAGS